MSLTSDKLVEKFKNVNVDDYPAITKLDCALDAGLWVLWVYEDALEQNGYLKSSEIAEILASAYGMPFEEIEINNAFKRAGKRLHKKKINGKMSYKIMIKGKDHLRQKAGAGDVEVFLIEGDAPRRSHKTLVEVVSNTKGTMKILDPYYGIKTLDMLEKLDHGTDIKFIASQIGPHESADRFGRELKLFEKDHPNIKLARYAKSNELHDRYIITDDTLIILGHGIKDLGGRESFVLVFKDERGKDIRSSLNQKFNDRWLKSQPLR